MPLPPSPPFFLYDHPSLDHSMLLECIPGWQLLDQSAEVAMLRLLQASPSRLLSPSLASLFVLPLFPYLSFIAGPCGSTTHDSRMAAAASTLLSSPSFRRRGGVDHLLITNTFQLASLRPLKPLLQNATIGWFESPTAPRRGPGRLAASAWWRCTLVVPYVASPFCSQQRSVRPTPACEGGRHSIFFQGSLGTGGIRRKFEGLRTLAGARVVDVPREGGGDSSGGRGEARGEKGERREKGEVCMRGEGSCSGKLELARRMLCSEVCLIPKGDTPTSSRFYTAIACDCVPLVISDDLHHHLPFAARLNYSWVHYVREREFVHAPLPVVASKLASMQPLLPSLRKQMRTVAKFLLYEEEGSRVAEEMLLEYERACKPPSQHG